MVLSAAFPPGDAHITLLRCAFSHALTTMATLRVPLSLRRKLQAHATLLDAHEFHIYIFLGYDTLIPGRWSDFEQNTCLFLCLALRYNGAISDFFLDFINTSHIWPRRFDLSLPQTCRRPNPSLHEFHHLS